MSNQWKKRKTKKCFVLFGILFSLDCFDFIVIIGTFTGKNCEISMTEKCPYDDCATSFDGGQCKVSMGCSITPFAVHLEKICNHLH